MNNIKRLVVLVALCFISVVANAAGWYRVTSERANVRTEPSTNSEILGELTQDYLVMSPDSIDNGWLKIEYADGYGYVSAKLVEYKEPYIPRKRTNSSENWIVNKLIEKYDITIPAVNNLNCTIAIVALILILTLNHKFLNKQSGKSYIAFAISHLAIVAISILIFWQMLAPEEQDYFMGNVTWFLADDSWLRIALYYIGFGIAIFYYFKGMLSTFSFEHTMPKKGKALWAVGLKSWILFSIAFVVCMIFDWDINILTTAFLCVQAAFILGMFIYYTCKGYLLWALLAIPTYILASISFTCVLTLFMVVIAIIVIFILVAILIITLLQNPTLILQWSSISNLWEGSDGHSYIEKFRGVFERVD